MGILKEDGKGDLHRITASLVLEYESEKMAENILGSIEVDNYNFVKCERGGKIIECKATSYNVRSLLHTLDDLLSCIITAEDIYRNI